MSASNKVTNALNFRSRALFNRLPHGKDSSAIMDPIKPDKIQVGNQVTADYYNYKIPNSIAWGGTSVFTISRTEGLIYDLYLEVILPADAVTYSPLPAVNIINRYQVLIGNELINCTGASMFEAQRHFMSDTIGLTYANYAGGAGGSGVVSQSVFTFLDYPGRVRSMNVNSSFSADDSWGVPFPLNKCNSDMQITITLPQAASMVVSGTLVGLPQLILHYQVVGTSKENVQLVNNSRNDSRICIPGYRLSSQISTASQTLSNTARITYDLSNTVLDGENICNLISVQIPADITNHNNVQGNLVQYLELDCSGSPFYIHQTTADGSFREFTVNNSNKFVTLSGATGTSAQTCNLYTYMIPGGLNPMEIFGSVWSCVNYWRNSPQLVLQMATATGTGYITCLSITKCYYEIDQYGTIMWYTTYSSN